MKSEVSYIVMKFMALIKNQLWWLSINLGLIMLKITLIIHHIFFFKRKG